MNWLILFFLLQSCSLFFRGEGHKSAKGSHYKIQFNEPNWTAKRDKRSDYVFENQADGRILLSNSFCNEFQDQPLEKLASRTFRSVGAFKAAKGDYTTFNNREAYKLDAMGNVDGVKVQLHLLNTRRNNCYFDFVSITPEKSESDHVADFEKFLSSVVFE